MSALGAPRAKEIVSGIGRPNLATSRPPASSANSIASGGRTDGASELRGRYDHQSSEARAETAEDDGAGGARTRGWRRWRARQYGVVGRWQLVELGFGDEAIKPRLASGRLHPLHREAYAVGHRIVVKRGKWLAAVLAMGPGAFLSHESAAALWGLVGGPAEGPRQRAAGTAGSAGTALWDQGASLQVRRRRSHASTTASPSRPSPGRSSTLPNDPRRHELKSAWDEADRLKRLRVPEVATRLRAWPRTSSRPRGPQAVPPRRAAPRRRHRLAARGPLRGVRQSDHRLPPAADQRAGRRATRSTCSAQARLIVELDSWEFHAHRRGLREGSRPRHRPPTRRLPHHPRHPPPPQRRA